MTTTLAHNRAILAEKGTISLPENIRQMAGLEPGDELIVVWSPPDTIIVRKLSEIVADDEAFATEMNQFDKALQSAGYETAADIIKLVRKVKTEQIAEWPFSKIFLPV